MYIRGKLVKLYILINNNLMRLDGLPIWNQFTRINIFKSNPGTKRLLLRCKSINVRAERQMYKFYST